MRTSTLLFSSLLAVAGIASAGEAKRLLQKALFAEEVEQDNEKAAALYQRMINQAESVPKQLAVARYHLAKLHLAASRRDAAVKQLQALTADPGVPADWVALANKLLGEIQPKAATPQVAEQEDVYDLLKDRVWNWHAGKDLHGKPAGALRFLPNGKVETTRGIDWLSGWQPLDGNRFKIIQIEGRYWIHEMMPGGRETRAISSTPPIDTEKRLALHHDPAISMDEAEIGFLSDMLASQPNVIAEWNVMANLAKLDRVRALGYLLDHGIPVDQRERHSFRWTPLMYAVDRGAVEMVRFLLDRGGDVNALDQRGASPLAIAAWRGNHESVKLLLDRGADMHRTSTFVYPEYPKLEMGTALHVAAMRGNLDVARVLMDRGADLSATSPQKNFTPLNCALGEGHPALARELLMRGADPNLPRNGPVSPLRQAAYAGDLEIVRLMLSKGARIDIQSDKIQQNFGVSRTVGAAIPAAARAGHLDVVDLLVNAGCPVDQTTPQYQETPLHAAALHGNAAMCRWLLEKGANPKHRLADDIDTQSGWMPLHSAAWRGSMEVVELLIANGASPEDPCFDAGLRRTAFHLAVLRGWLPVVHGMLAQPAYQNREARKRLLAQPDLHGNTALHLAACRDATPNQDIVKLLIASGGSADLTNMDNLTPRQLAVDPARGTRDEAVRKAIQQETTEGTRSGAP